MHTKFWLENLTGDHWQDMRMRWEVIFLGYFVTLSISSISVSVASNCDTIGEKCIGMDLEGSGGRIIEILSRHVSRGTEENRTAHESGLSLSRPRLEPSIYLIRVLPLP
jgi:hypothetical protein